MVFDFDGLIADTEWPEYRSIAQQFEARGHAFPPESWVQVIGSSWDVDWLGDLAQRVGGDLDRAAVREAHRAHKAELMAGLAPLPGVAALLAAAEAAGLGLAVASSSPRRWVEPWLETLGLRHHFSIVVVRDDVAQAKPAPDLFRAACVGLGLAPGEAVALEDSAHGVTSAKAAGLACVAVPNRLTRYLDLSAADLVVSSLAEVDVGRLGRLVAAA